MINNKEKYLMMIEPELPVMKDGIYDELTTKMTDLWNSKATFDPNTYYKGVHACSCGAFSDNRKWMINDLETNSLLLHYITFHRHEIPPIELEKISKLVDLQARSSVSIVQNLEESPKTLVLL